MSGEAAPLPQRASLIVINPSGNRTRLPLSPLPFTIGRQADNHLVLRDSRISRRHARLLEEDGEFFIEDANSRHGVTVNGSRVEGRRRLASGDRIEFGVSDSYQLIFLVEESEIRRLLEQFDSASSGQQKGPPHLAKLRALVEVARTVQSALSAQAVLAAVVDAAITVTGAERGFLLLRQGDGLQVEVARDHRGLALAPEALQVPVALIQRALEERRELLTMTFDPRQLAQAGDAAADPSSYPNVLCVPLVHVRTAGSEETMALTARADSVGVLYLESRPGGAALAAGDRELLQTLALEASTILENARLLEQERLRERMERELEIAREVQMSLMPRRLPDCGWFRAAAASIPSHQVGGDLCDVRELGHNAWVAIIADVSGKGVSSALLASLLHGAFLVGGSAVPHIDQLMTQINRFLAERSEAEKYATVFCALIEADGRMRWINAGHCPVLWIRRQGEITRLIANCLPLGLLEEATFHVEQIRLEPGDKLLAYTDGITEARNAQGQFFEARRLEQWLQAHAQLSCQPLLAELMEMLESYTEGVPQSDDMTAVIIEYLP